MQLRDQKSRRPSHCCRRVRIKFSEDAMAFGWSDREFRRGSEASVLETAVRVFGGRN